MILFSAFYAIFMSSSVSYFIKQGWDKFIPVFKYRIELFKVIYTTLKEFKQKYPIESQGKKKPFYKSIVIIGEIVKLGITNKIDQKIIFDKLKKNNNIIPPDSIEIEKFLEIFASNWEANKKFKDLHIDKNYKSEIFKISTLLTETFELTNETNSIIKKTDDRFERNKFQPFKRLSEWSCSKRKTDFYENERIIFIKEQIRNGKDDIRFLGLSGLGKTRIVQETFINDDSNSNCLYCDLQDTTEQAVQAKLQEVFDENNNEIIIIDNCTLVLFRKILRLKLDNNVENRIITIFNDPNDDSPSKIEDVDYIKLNINDLDSVVSDILKNQFGDINQTQLDTIKKFSEGIPLMAVLLAQNFRKGDRNLGNLSDNELLDKLLSIESEEEKEILKACSIFRFIGFEGEVKNQIEFILSSNFITQIDLGVNRMNRFQKVFNKYRDREIFDINGRLFGIRPRPLAFYLAREWFNTCTKDNLVQLVENLQNTNNLYSKNLTESLCKQIVNLGDNEKAVELLGSITAYNGPFDNAEVLNTELGSRLFRSFVEVNPVAVADNLFRNFGSLTIEQLKEIEDGRRNLIWTLEKLCFDARTFEKGAKLMMRFATAENETYGNNATNEFTHLFKIQLPGTEASLKERLEIIKWGFSNNECKELSIKAIGSALDTLHFNYFCGAETQGTKKLEHYKPKTWEEIFDYLSPLLNMIKEEIKLDSPFSDLCSKIIVDKVRSLYMFGAWEIVEPIIKEIVEIKNNDWDDLLERLYDIKNYDFKKEQSTHQEIIEDLISKLTKTDFVSRFIEANKFRHKWNSQDLSYEEQIKERHKLNIELAKEFVSVENLSQVILEKLYCLETPIGNIFGYTIAKQIKDDNIKNHCFIDSSIQIFKSLGKYNPIIFINYTSGINKQTFEYIVSALKKEDSLSHLLFPILSAYNININETEVLFDLVKNKVVKVSEFENFWRLYSNEYSDNEIFTFLNKILLLDADAYITVLNIANSLICFNSESKYSKVECLVENCIIEHGLSSCTNDTYYLVENILNNSYKSDFAKKMNLLLIKLAGDYSSFNFGNSNIERIYSLLIGKYFDDIWNDLSRALLSDGDEYFVFFNLKSLLGATIGSMHNSVGILFANGNTDKIFEWCKENRDNAPSRIMELVPVFEGEGFNPFVKRLIDEFGNDIEMLNALSSNMRSFSWTGSVIPLYEQKKAVLQSIITHPIQTVSDWAKQQIEYVDKEIEYEIKLEKESKLLYS